MHAGSRMILIEDSLKGISFSAHVVYPTDVPSTPTMIGPFTFDVSPEAPLSEGIFPLVVISHGGGGWNIVYRTISTHLARNGYIVVAPEHYKNNRNDNELEDTTENLENRPRHISLTIDTLVSNPDFREHVSAIRVAIIGHSMGGYTALAIAGGVPWTKDNQKVSVVRDPRISALVLLAPAAAFFIPEDSLKNVTLPILMLAAEHDPITPRWQDDVVLDGVPDRSKVTFRVIENAGHLSFLSPYPDHLKRQGFFPAMDPEGFDREAFHEELPIELEEFLAKYMK